MPKLSAWKAKNHHTSAAVVGINLVSLVESVQLFEVGPCIGTVERNIYNQNGGRISELRHLDGIVVQVQRTMVPEALVYLIRRAYESG